MAAIDELPLLTLQLVLLPLALPAAELCVQAGLVTHSRLLALLLWAQLCLSPPAELPVRSLGFSAG